MHDRIAAQQNAGPGVLRVLVVDDNPDITESLSILLGLLDHQVAVENRAREALARLARETFDVCLLDIGMPEMDGLTLARRIRATIPAPQPALVAVTGFGEASDRRAALEAGFDRFLVKPLTAGMLTAVLEELAPAPNARH